MSITIKDNGHIGVGGIGYLYRIVQEKATGRIFRHAIGCSCPDECSEYTHTEHGQPVCDEDGMLDRKYWAIERWIYYKRAVEREAAK